MNQQLRIQTLFTNRLWLLGLIAAALLLVAQQAHAAGETSGIVSANMPQQFVDLDGDGQRESFSGTLTVYNDGTADGQFLIAHDFSIEPQTGSVRCVDGTAVVEVQGTAYQNESGALNEIGTVTVSLQPAAGQGGNDGIDIILFDIVDAAVVADGQNGGGNDGIDIILFDIVDAAVTGSLNVTADPCATATMSVPTVAQAAAWQSIEFKS